MLSPNFYCVIHHMWQFAKFMAIYYQINRIKALFGSDC